MSKSDNIETKAEAVSYLEAADANGAPCEYGHYGCAAREWGPCSDEVRAAWNLDYEE